MERNIRKQGGFTLIELMIVVAIVGILAAVAIPAYQDYIIRSKTTEIMAQVDMAKTTLGEHFLATGAMPAAADDIVTDLDSRLEATDYISAVTWTPSDEDGDTNNDRMTIAITVDTSIGAGVDATNNTWEFYVDGDANGVTLDCASSANTTFDAKWRPANCR